MNLNQFKTILKELIGNENTLSNNVLFIDFCGGMHGKAQFLSQLFYWQGKAKRADGYFYKRYEEWEAEIRVPKHSLMRYSKDFQEAGFLETKIKKANGFPVVHYRLDIDILLQSLVTFCDNRKLQFATIESDNLQLSLESDNLQLSNNIDYNKLQTENTDNGEPIGSPSHEKIDGKKIDPAFKLVLDAFHDCHLSYHKKKNGEANGIVWTKKERGSLNRIACELRRMLSEKEQKPKIDISADSIANAMRAVLLKMEMLPDKWLAENHYTPSGVWSQWNKIVNAVKTAKTERQRPSSLSVIDPNKYAKYQTNQKIKA